MASWVKKKCFVVTAFYRDELYQENETPMKEEEVFLSESEAEKCKEEFEADSDFEAVYIEEEVREFWSENEEESIDFDFLGKEIYVQSVFRTSPNQTNFKIIDSEGNELWTGTQLKKCKYRGCVVDFMRVVGEPYKDGYIELKIEISEIQKEVW